MNQKAKVKHFVRCTRAECIILISLKRCWLLVETAWNRECTENECTRETYKKYRSFTWGLINMSRYKAYCIFNQPKTQNLETLWEDSNASAASPATTGGLAENCWVSNPFMAKYTCQLSPYLTWCARQLVNPHINLNNCFSPDPMNMLLARVTQF